MAQKSFGNWVFERILGAGGFGQVELWKEKYSHKRIAIKKCMLPISEETTKQMERWEKEIENMKNLNHPNIVSSECLPSEMKFNLPVLCMEYCNKGNLREVLQKPENACGLIYSEVISVMKDISSALKFLHYKNITHRDLKPDNIVLHEKNNMIIYKLIDLGYAKELGNATTTASLVGTFNYVAPELFYNNKYTCSVDYWSLGILFFEVLTGYKPFILFHQNLKKWIKNMKNKTYEQICAKEMKEDIEFYDYIIYPNDLSEDILHKMVEWFRIVLQWDPRRRGKRPGCDEIVVFPLLTEIFSWKTIYIFSLPFYRMDQFNVNSNTSFNDLQQWIEKKTSIPVREQVIVDTMGNVLSKIKNTKTFLMKDVLDCILYVYKNNSLKLIDIDSDYKIPKILDLMLIEPEAINDGSSLKQCCTALIYIMRHEIQLIKQFMLALGTKLDIMNNRLNSVNNKIQKTLPNAESLLQEVETSLVKVQSLKNKNNLTELITSMNKLFDKTKSLYATITQLMSETNNTHTVRNQIKEFFDSEELINSLQQYSQIYEEYLKKFEDLKFENERTCNTQYINKHVIMLSDILCNFVDQKAKQLNAPEIFKLTNQLEYLEKKLHLHLEVIDSCMELVPSYKTQYIDLISKIDQCIHSRSITMLPSNIEPNINLNSIASVSSEATSSQANFLTYDVAEIRDNIALRSLLNIRLQDIQQILQDINMDQND